MTEALQEKLADENAHSILTPAEKREIRAHHTTQQVIIAGLLVAAGGELTVTDAVFTQLELGRTTLNRTGVPGGYHFWVSETAEE